MAAESYKIKCDCGAFLIVRCTGEIAPGNRMREEVYCPKCKKEVFSSLTSGFVNATEITEEQYNDSNFE